MNGLTLYFPPCCPLDFASFPLVDLVSLLGAQVSVKTLGMDCLVDPAYSWMLLGNPKTPSLLQGRVTVWTIIISPWTWSPTHQVLGGPHGHPPSLPFLSGSRVAGEGLLAAAKIFLTLLLMVSLVLTSFMTLWQPLTFNPLSIISLILPKWGGIFC